MAKMGFSFNVIFLLVYISSMRLVTAHILSGLLQLQFAQPWGTSRTWHPVDSLPSRLAYPETSIDREAGLHTIDGSKPAQKGAVASEDSRCSQIGLDMLKLGGNAADSMVATMFCVGVVSMYHSGIGGGGFALIRGPRGGYEFIDFREAAPWAATEDMFQNRTRESIYGGAASGVPGEVRGLEYIHKHYGKLPWREVVFPAVRLARDGFEVREDLVRNMAVASANGNNFLTDDPAWAADFAPKGKLLELGDIMTRGRYATTLRKIALHGADAMHDGKIADEIYSTIQATSGNMTTADLKDYAVKVRDVMNITYRDFTIRSGSAPSSGSVVLSALKILEGYEDIGHAEVLNLSTHRFDEALRYAYGQRTELGDPDYWEIMPEFEANMTDVETARSIRKRISDFHTHPVREYNPNGNEVLNTPGTSAIVTSDSTGLAIALTSTINLVFGSQVMTRESGIILNNEMNDFSIPGVSNAFGFRPSVSNFIRPGKRPMSSVAPVIIEHKNGSLYYVVAAAGGSRIITAIIQNIWNVIDRNMTAAEGVREPRLHDQLLPNQVNFESAYDNSTVEFMKSRGHEVAFMPSYLSAAHAIRVTQDNTYDAAAESRQMNSGASVL